MMTSTVLADAHVPGLAGGPLTLETANNSTRRLLRNFDQSPSMLILGRAPGADIQLADRWVSRMHCSIERYGPRLLVRDLGSRHGTWVNGEPVDEAFLVPGDELSVGISTFVVNCFG